MEQEIWKDIPGYEGIYQASTLGNIRSVDRIMKKGNRWGSYNNIRCEGKILNQRVTGTLKYKTCLFSVFKKRKNCLVHRLIAKTFLPNPHNLPVVNHKDGDKMNNKVSNLEWLTRNGNIKHAINLGLFDVSGEKNYSAKLTAHDVSEIRSKYVPHKYTSQKLANEFKVSVTSITNIIRGKTWTNI